MGRQRSNARSSQPAVHTGIGRQLLSHGHANLAAALRPRDHRAPAPSDRVRCR